MSRVCLSTTSYKWLHREKIVLRLTPLFGIYLAKQTSKIGYNDVADFRVKLPFQDGENLLKSVLPLTDCFIKDVKYKSEVHMKST